MKKISFLFFTIFISVFGILTSCKKDKTDASTLPVKIAPVSIAGNDKIVVLPADSVLLEGSGRDLDGTIINYKWSKISGPASFIIVNANAAVTKVINMIPGVYEFELMVTDNDGLSSKGRVKVYLINSCPCTPDCDPWGDPCDPWDY